MDIELCSRRELFTYYKRVHESNWPEKIAMSQSQGTKNVSTTNKLYIFEGKKRPALKRDVMVSFFIQQTILSMVIQTTTRQPCRLHCVSLYHHVSAPKPISAWRKEHTTIEKLHFGVPMEVHYCLPNVALVDTLSGRICQVGFCLAFFLAIYFRCSAHSLKQPADQMYNLS